MNVVSVKEVWEGRQTSIDESSLVERTRVWRVVVDDARVSDYLVIEAFSATTGIRRYSPWISINGEVDSTVRAQSLTAKQDSEAFTYTVSVSYTSGRASTGGGIDPRQERERSAQTQRGMSTGEQPKTNPTQRPQVLSWGSVEQQVALNYDADDGFAINNSAGEKFVPAPTVSIAYLTLKIERNQLLYNPVFYLGYANRVNSANLVVDGNVFPPYTVLNKPVVAEKDHEGGVSFHKVTFNLHINFFRHPVTNELLGWQLLLVDAGLNEKMPNGKYNRIKDQHNREVTIPWPLNGEGRKQNLDVALKYRRFNRYKLADLNDLAF